MALKLNVDKSLALMVVFSKEHCQCELLCSIGRDANNHMYPVAWAIVDKETKENWEWFIGLLIKDLDINDDGVGWVFISDQQKVIFAFSNVIYECHFHIFFNNLSIT
jgi:hypothetical protein